jgi:uncharacterized protein
MKLQPDRSPQQSVISLSDGVLLTSHGHRAKTGVMLSGEGLFIPLAHAELEEGIANQLNQLPLENLEVLIIGTGEQHAFFSPVWRKTLKNPLIGIESMTTPAACRTFNVLSLEGRRVALWARL